MTAGVDVSFPGSPAHGPGDAPDLEARGWSSLGLECAPKIAALAALARIEAPQPVPRVSYRSRGNLLIVAGDAPERARGAAQDLAAGLHVTLLDAKGDAASGAVTEWAGRVDSITGYLGEFSVTIAGLRAPGAAQAQPAAARFDLVLDFSAEPLFLMRQPPQGYFRAPADAAGLVSMLSELREAVGEFEKPRFFAYRENLCAHGRSGIAGCTSCVDICSTRAIASDGDRVKVDPHLCMGCGACSTVCPSGAMSYQFPRVPERGQQLRRMLAAYREAGGANACIVWHDGAEGRDLLRAAARDGQGLPARALPLEAFHVAAIGLDLMLPALAFGAGQVVVVAGPGEDAEYLEALREQMRIGATVLEALGYGGSRLELVQARDGAALQAAFDALPTLAGLAPAAGFDLSADKRTAIEFALDHLVRHAPRRVEHIDLPVGAPYGEIRVDRDACTMCMSCVGACPESALMDGVDRPLLKFLERNCVQCGLCEATCPEDAITLHPRLLLTPAVREPRVLNETEPFHCVSCNKPFGTRQMVEAMMGRLASHSMFTGQGALRRLQMCADCRVVDMMSSKSETSVLDLGADR
ncbi:MAG TPA: 4Fe-4S binding protein [Usitatibacter sp.]|nr:4Fe-4S binding protein [Usitatibacter sp.]